MRIWGPQPLSFKCSNVQLPKLSRFPCIHIKPPCPAPAFPFFRLKQQIIKMIDTRIRFQCGQDNSTLDTNNGLSSVNINWERICVDLNPVDFLQYDKHWSKNVKFNKTMNSSPESVQTFCLASKLLSEPFISIVIVAIIDPKVDPLCSVAGYFQENAQPPNLGRGGFTVLLGANQLLRALFAKANN